MTRAPLATLALLVLAGCASARHAYVQTYWGHTEKLEMYDGFGTALRVRATYLSTGFRTAMADERARLLGPSSDDHEAFKARLLADADVYHEIFFTAESSYDRNQLRFGEDDEGWHIRLEADGSAQDLVTVYQVKKPTLLHERLLDGYDRYTQLWIAKFARTATAPDELVLHLGSGHGHTQIRWAGDQLR
ncbi:MAG: hypothetical protein H6732_04530 [Alphaproteobacteria bacterium]|nr:hypothetical protein [Alphaproteobacteria bacterium]